MTTLNGHYFDGKTSVRIAAVCSIDKNGKTDIRSEAEGILLASAPDFSISVSSRLGNTPRVLTFADRSVFITEQNDAVDRLEKQFSKQTWMRLVYILESRKRFVISGICLMVLIVWVAVKFGLPMSAKLIAFALPDSIMTYTSHQTLTLLDKSLLAPTKLEIDQQQDLIRQFQPILSEYQTYPVHVLFRSSDPIGANAFALPNGTIILTDAMVSLASNTDELKSILVHEIGHIVHRHGIRRLVQDSLLGFLVMALTGDASNASELLVGIPVLLTELSYSREFELEADEYARQYMNQHTFPLSHFSTIMKRIEANHVGVREKSECKFLDYLSTHPDLAERLVPFEK